MNSDLDELGLHEGTHYALSGKHENSLSRLMFEGGPYTEAHKRLRKTWHQTWLKLMNRSEIDELVSNSGKRVVLNLSHSAFLG